MRNPLFIFLFLAMVACGQENLDVMSQLGIPPNSLLKNAKTLGLGTKGQLPLDPSAKLVTDAAVGDSLYMVGPGDVFSIYLGETRQFMVNAEGYLQLPDVRPVKVSGNSLLSAKSLIKSSLRKAYDTSKVFVSLASIKDFKVHVLGEVMNPGVKTITGLNRVDEVILQSGGFSNGAIRDRIWIIRSGGDSVEVELQRYFDSYDDADNPYLNMGDKVIVKAVDPNEEMAVLRINNSVFFHKTDGGYNLKRVFNQISGYSANDFPPHARIIGRNSGAKHLNLKDAIAYVPAPGDTVELLRGFENVFVGGAVARPSLYPYIPQYTVTDYLFQAGILPITQHESSAEVVRNGVFLSLDEVDKTGVKPGDKIRINRSRVEESRDYLSILASLAGIVLSAATLYYTFSLTN